MTFFSEICLLYTIAANFSETVPSLRQSLRFFTNKLNAILELNRYLLKNQVSFFNRKSVTQKYFNKYLQVYIVKYRYLYIFKNNISSRISIP